MHELNFRQIQVLLDNVVITRPRGLRTCMETLATRGETNVLDKHAVVEPAHPTHIPVNSEDEADRCAKKAVILRVKLARLLPFTLPDTEKSVKIPTDLTASCEVGITVFLKIVQPVALMLFRRIPECV